MRSDLVVAFLLTLALHASVLLLAAALFDRAVARGRLGWRECAWRLALFGGALTAGAQVFAGHPVAPRFTLPSNGTAAAAGRLVDAEPARAAVGVESARPLAAPLRPEAEDGAGVRPSRRAAEGRVARPSVVSASEWMHGRVTWQGMLACGWLAGALLALLRVLRSWSRLRRQLVLARPLDRAPVALDAAALALAACIGVPRLAQLDDLASPMAVPGGCIVMPRWALDLLDREQVRAMLAHETAHLARHDPAWKLAIALWCALLWFLPLGAVRRRLDGIAELACDAWAARHLGDGRALAECLAECAEQCGGFEPGLASAMAHRQSPLVERIEHLIEGVPMDIRFPRLRAMLAVVLVLAGAAALLPGFGVDIARAVDAVAPAPAAPVAPVAPVATAAAAGSHIHVSSRSGDAGGHDSTVVQVSANGHVYGATIEGHATFDEHDELAALGDGDTASFTERTPAGVTRRVEYGGAHGALTRRYLVDGTERPVDADGQAWIDRIVGVVLREGAIDAPARVARLHARGGADAVLDEIGRTGSGYARSVYIAELAKLGALQPAQATRAIAFAGDIDSDYERRNALAAIAASRPLDAARQQLVLAQARKIASDYERAELLVGMLPVLAPGAAVRDAWLQAASGIGSDYEHRRVLSALIQQGPVDEAMLAGIIASAKSIGSDYERRTLLVDAIRGTADADAVAPAYAAAVAGIGSDYERREALLALVRAPRFGLAGSRAVLAAAADIGSDFECREVLVALARVMPADPALIRDYRQVARRLGDFERGQAERALDRFAG
jgi:beta-lactamase regulating signal transducer with metallopeptidase domain